MFNRKFEDVEICYGGLRVICEHHGAWKRGSNAGGRRSKESEMRQMTSITFA